MWWEFEQSAYRIDDWQRIGIADADSDFNQLSIDYAAAGSSVSAGMVTSALGGTPNDHSLAIGEIPD